jgi:hypothetical protein
MSPTSLFSFSKEKFLKSAMVQLKSKAFQEKQAQEVKLRFTPMILKLIPLVLA